MKLLLTPGRVATLSAKVAPSRGDLSLDVQTILKAFREESHLVFTRPDVTAVLNSLGYSGTEGGEMWSDIGRAIKSFSTKVSHGYWALNEGLLNSPPPVLAPKKPSPEKAEKASLGKGPSITAAWFEKQMAEKALDRRVAAIIRRKNPRESWESILSIVHLWFAQWAASGHCDEHIKAGKPPSASILAIWVDHKKTHAVYHDGLDALTRHMVGARTQHEIRMKRETEKDFVHPESLVANPDIRVVDKSSHGDPPSAEGGLRHLEFVSLNQADPLAETLREEEVGLVRDVVRVIRDRSGDRYVRFLDYMLRGSSREEIALLENVTPLRVSHILQRVRDDMRAAPEIIRNSLKVLEVVCEEPWSSISEISSEAGSAEDVEKAIRLLVARKLVEEKRGAFAPTRAGAYAAEVGQIC